MILLYQLFRCWPYLPLGSVAHIVSTITNAKQNSKKEFVFKHVK